ncbi:MAG: PP2C family protein-serine/threonine phosphatase [Planctomycetota bacterium]
MSDEISPELAERYEKATADLIASRLRWLIPTLIGMLLFGGIPQAFDPLLSADRRITATCIRFVSAIILAALWRVCRGARGLSTLRSFAYVFVVMGFLTMTTIQMVSRPLRIGPTIYIVLTYINCFLVPWRVRDTILIVVMGFAAYTAEAIKIGDFPKTDTYLLSSIFFVMGSFMAVLLKRDDERRRLHEFLLQDEVKRQKEELERDLDFARRVHLSLIPQSVEMDEAEVAVAYAPMSYIGGDYANFVMAQDGRLVFFMSDITGHGVPAALIANRIHTEVQRLMKEPIGPGELLHQLDVFATAQLEGTDLFLSAFSGILDFGEKKLIYSNHGHPPQILYQKREGRIQLLKPRSPLLGIGIPGPPPQESETDLPLERGDRVILFTDGITETHGRNEEMFGQERLEAFATEHASLPPKQFNEALTQAIDTFREGPIRDDLFLLTIRVK